MNTELILLIISLSSNLLIIFKRVKVLWTPCLVCDCRSGNDGEDLGTPSSVNTGAESSSDKIKRALSKFYKPKNKNIIDTEIKG